MLQKVFKLLIHPFLVYALIAALECIPYYPNAPKVVLYEMPLKGDNFGVPHSQAVYYYSGKGKYAYTSVECYFSYGNPSFDIGYKNGGIKTIDTAIANKIPLLGDMCDEAENVAVKKNTSTIANIFSTNFLLDYFSGVSHILSYLVLSLSILYHLRLQKKKYWIAFITVFIGGGILEFIQEFFILGRNASFEDQVSNCIGAIIGMLLFWILFKMKSLQKRM